MDVSNGIAEKFRTGDCGIAFVAKTDPVNRLVMAVTKQEFSSVGFYHTTSITGKPRVNMVLADLFDESWSNVDVGVSSLLSSPLVSKLAVRSLKPIFKTASDRSDGNGRTDRDSDAKYDSPAEVDADATRDLHTEFRSAIASSLSAPVPISMRKTICQLFGRDTVDNDGTDGERTVIDVVNGVIEMIGRLKDIPTDSSISLDVVDILRLPQKKDTATVRDKLQLIGYLGSGLNHPSKAEGGRKPLQSFLVDSTLFDDLVYLKSDDGTDRPVASLPFARSVKHSAETVEKAIQEAFKTSRGKITSIFSEFVELIMEDGQFANAISSGIEEGQERSNFQLVAFANHVRRSNERQIDLLETLSSWFHRPSDRRPGSGAEAAIDAADLRGKINRLQETIKESEVIADRVYDVRSVDGERTMMPVLTTTQEYVVAVRDLHGVCVDVLKTVEDGGTPIVDLNAILRSVNSLCVAGGLSLEPLRPIEDQVSYRAVLSAASDGVFQVETENDEFVLPLKNPDLSGVSQKLLMHILHEVDNVVTSANKHKYDQFRQSIIDEIHRRE